MTFAFVRKANILLDIHLGNIPVDIHLTYTRTWTWTLTVHVWPHCWQGHPTQVVLIGCSILKKIKKTNLKTSFQGCHLAVVLWNCMVEIRLTTQSMSKTLYKHYMWRTGSGALTYLTSVKTKVRLVFSASDVSLRLALSDSHDPELLVTLGWTFMSCCRVCGSQERWSFFFKSKHVQSIHTSFSILGSTHLVLGGESDVKLESHGRQQACSTVASAHHVGSPLGPPGFLVWRSRGLGRDRRSNSSKALMQASRCQRLVRYERGYKLVLNHENLQRVVFGPL